MIIYDYILWLLPDYDEADSKIAKHPGEEKDHIEKRHRHHNLHCLFVCYHLNIDWFYMEEI